MSYQDELNRINKTTDRTINECLNTLAGTTNLDSTLAANTYAATEGLRHQDAINSKAGVTDMNLSKQDAAKLIETPA